MTTITAFSRSDSPAARARSTSPAGRHMPTDETIEQIIQQATANARAASGGRTPVIGRDTRTQLFVGNLPYRVRWQDLKDLFRKAGGTVLRADVSLGPDNRSRGYGTVLLSSAEDAGRAIDMFNGYVWQTRTLEVRPDRLPNDFDSSGLIMSGGQLNTMPSGLSPQLRQFGNITGGASSALHSLSLSPSSAGSASLQPTALTSSISVSTNGLAQSALAMSTGMGISLDSNGFSNDTVRPTSFLGDMSRSPSAFKMPSSNAALKPQKPFDTLGLSSSSLGGLGVGTSSLTSSQSGFPMGNTSNSTADFAGRTIYVANWPSQYGPLDFDQFFRSAGKVLRSDLGVAGGMENRGYGTVVYSSEDEAKGAMARFNGYELNGWILRLQIGKSEHQQQPIPSSQLVGAGLADSHTIASRRSDEYIQPPPPAPVAAMSISNPSAGAVTAVVNGVTTGEQQPSYSYATYMTMGPPGMPTGYMVASQPGSPYDPYPPSLAYVPVAASPGSGYPPPLNSGMYAYSTWHHHPPAPAPAPASPPIATGDMSTSAASTGAGGVSNITKPTQTSSNGTTSGNMTTSSTSRAPPGRIQLPNPGLAGFAPAPISPMHGRPPITPSMPSFTFISQPMPTPPLHPQFLSPGLGPYSPITQAPSFYRPSYFNLAPGAPVHYHHDPNTMPNNGIIGSGSNRANAPGMMGSMMSSSIMGGGLGMSNGQVTTPYFDMTAATAGSDVPQEYFPPMPITASLAGAVHSMNLSSTSATNSAVGSSTGASSIENSRSTMGQSGTEEDSPYLEPVGVGRDGFPSLSAKHSDKSGPPADGMSRTGLTDWVTTPDDLPISASALQASKSPVSSHRQDSGLPVPTPPNGRSISADIGPPSVDPKKSTTPPFGPHATAGSTSPSSAGSGPIYSSSNKPKLTLGPIPRFQPPERMINAYAAMAHGIGRTASGSGGASGAPTNSSSVQKVAGNKGSEPKNPASDETETETENPGFATALGVGAGALKVNGTPNGFRDSLETGVGVIRRASWTEDASRRQSIVNGLHGGQAHEGEYVR